MKSRGISLVTLMVVGGVSAAADAAPVGLLVARYQGNIDMSAPYVEGAIEVDDLAFEKVVRVHYRWTEEDVASDWLEVTATYAGELGPRSERWVFRTDCAPAHPRGANFELYVEYEVEGRLHVDDNAHDFYHVGSGYLDSEHLPAVLGRQNVAVIHASMSRPDRATVSVVVKDLGDDKQITVVYSTNQWRTVHMQEARLQYGYGSDAESWLAVLELGEADGRIDFAVRYSVNGTRYWDNNDWQNYTITYDPRP